jgi:hypothetical protein
MVVQSAGTINLFLILPVALCGRGLKAKKWSRDENQTLDQRR